MYEDLKLLAALLTAGVAVGIAKMLVSEEPIKIRQAVGRAILSGALGLAAGAIVIVVPGITLVAQVGLACAVSSLGTSALEKLFSRLVAK